MSDENTIFKLREVEIHYTRPVLTCLKRITTFSEAVHILRDYVDENRLDYKECVWLLLLNRANYVLGMSQIGNGTSHHASVNIREIFQLALCANASAVILAHNHPSGNLLASMSDTYVTEKIMEFGKLIEIDLLDHIILTSEGASSVRYPEGQESTVPSAY